MVRRRGRKRHSENRRPLATSCRKPISEQQPETVPSLKQAWLYPCSVMKFAEQLLTQQLWCWGQDVKCPDGNLLLEYGFARHRGPVVKPAGSTCYCLEQGSIQINLWGFGIFFGKQNDGGVFLDRYKFQPQWTEQAKLESVVHWRHKLAGFSQPRQPAEWHKTGQLCIRLLNWIAEYECWVRKLKGAFYREECLKNWNKPCLNPCLMSEAWRFLGQKEWDDEAAGWQETLSDRG